MFSDRLWILKLALVLGLLGWVSLESRKALKEAHPEVERLALFPELFRDRTIHISNYHVIGLDPTGFQIWTSVGPMHLQTEQKVAVGDVVSALARALGPRRMEVLRLEINEGFRWKRALNYAASLLTLLAYLWLIRRWFRWNPEGGVFRSRY